METRETIEVLPSAARLVGSLRDVGYSFRGAIADLIDNSIAANASLVSITISWHGAESFIRIADNGDGMDSACITEALRFGSDREYKLDDLGKFGLGLNTASLSQCKNILVASKPIDGDGQIHARSFDVDLINERDAWIIESVPEAELPPEAVDPLSIDNGTCVVWSKLDRVLGDHFQDTNRAKDRFFDHAEELERHLGMVFHKFIEGTATRRLEFEIQINGRSIEPWNPFALDEEATLEFSDDQFDISSSGASGTVRATSYVLPRKDEFTSDKEFERLSGPSKWNQQQGFYIYRSDRMIQSGGWSRLGAADEHTKQARVALEFFPELDPAFGINIAKMTVAIPRTLRDLLKPKVASLRGHAKRSYGQASAKKLEAINASGSNDEEDVPREKLEVAAPKQPESGFGIMPNTRDEYASTVTVPWPPKPISPPLQLIMARRISLETAAESVGESAALIRIIEAVTANDPGVAHDLGW